MLLTLFFSSLVTLAMVHWVANSLSLYWEYLWLDIPMHFLGGVVIALGVSILPFMRVFLPKSHDTLLGYVCLGLILGTIWEIFEYATGISIMNKDFIPDTTLDYIMDLLGLCTGYGIVQSVKKLERS